MLVEVNLQGWINNIVWLSYVEIMEIERIIKKYEYMMFILINHFNIRDYDFKEDVLQELRMHLFNLFKGKRDLSIVEDLDSYIFITLKNKVINILKKMNKNKCISLNKVIDENGIEHLDLLESNTEASQEEIYVYENIITYINLHFSEQDKQIINKYFFENLTYEQIGNHLSVSRETVRRKLNDTIDKIRRWYK